MKLAFENQGTVYWVTGLAGAGKTTLASLLVRRLRADGRSVVMLDGDTLRAVLGGQAGYSKVERLALACQYGAMCQLIAGQGVDVVCATISMFHQVRSWNREHIDKYCEIYVKVPMAVLANRDQKGLYRNAKAGLVDNVLGVNAPFEEPECPDIILANDGSRGPEIVLEELLDRINQWSGE